jgi:3-hydroxybutyryl-CoA dehydratase
MSVTLSIGMKQSLTKTVTEEDIEFFARATGDMNPLHLDESYARSTRFGGRIAHGLLGAGLISAILGTLLPGPGTVYLSQKLTFTAPVRIGDRITASVEVKSIKQRRVSLKTICVNQDGKMVIDGEAEVLAPSSGDSP